MLGVADAIGHAARPVGIAGEADRRTCAVDDERWNVPPSLAVMLQPLETLHRPTGALYRLYTDAQPTSGATPTSYRYGPNRIDVGGTPVDVGFSIDLTIDPALQALAQKTAACYTGRQDVCRALGLARSEDAAHAIGHRLLERAMVRMAAVAVIDVASGRIEALAGALSPCTRQEYDGPGRARGLRQAPAVSDSLPARCAAQPGRLSRRDAGVDDQADHGRGVPVRSRTSARAGSPPSGPRCSAPARRRATACAAS